MPNDIFCKTCTSWDGDYCKQRKVFTAPFHRCDAKDRKGNFLWSKKEAVYKTEPICKYCNFWLEKDYCVCKDLYTSTNPNDKCDEVDFYGNLMFAERK